MSFKWSVLFLFITGEGFAGAVYAQNMPGQKLPLQQDVLQSMRVANDHFMRKWPDPGASIVAGVGGQSPVRAKAIYYEGLMALYSVDPKKEYYDYAIRMTIDSTPATDKRDAPVLAALVQVLSLLPVNEPHRAEYIKDYLDIVRAIVPLQRADGYWNASLNDSTHFGEFSRTALFTYGISWGIRQGFLDKKVYLPVVTLSWDAIQKVQEPEDYYDLGCFLLAGSEVYQMATVKDNRDESKVPPYTEPDVLKTAAGGVVRSVKEWENVQRPYLYGVFEKSVYGRMPVKAVPVTYTTESVDSSAVESLAIRKEVTIHFSATDTA
ncbi:MAG TPA: glycoside hydrolase family 88 protein, partial [Puia sp.]|nr:glycoside hydrolase family 88 protein [Puia sp.]